MSEFETIKIYSVNAFAFLSTGTSIDFYLKVALVVVSVAYTLLKCIAIIKNNFEDEQDNN